MKRRVGRSVYSRRVAAELLRRIADGESLNAVCGKGRAPGLPERMTVYGWMKRRPGFREAYERALAARAALGDADVWIGDVDDGGAGAVPAGPRKTRGRGGRVARASAYHPRIAGEIVRRIAQGEPLTAICGPGRRAGMVECQAVYKWLERFEPFRRAFLTARVAAMEALIDEVIPICDRPGRGEALARDRLAVGVRRWRVETMGGGRLWREWAEM